MPELPEVETIARRLRAAVVGRRVERADVRSPRVAVGSTPRALQAALTGRRIVAVRRRAKYLLLDLDDGRVLVVHLRMTGDLRVVDGDEPKARVSLTLDDGRALAFTDPRHLGEWRIAARGDEVEAALGPEPLDDGFDGKALRAALAGKRAPLKAALMDQSVVAGLGNIYADEALFAARLHPKKPAGDVDGPTAKRLVAAIRRVLLGHVDETGGDVAWRYADRRAPSPFTVYGRAGQPCTTCGAKLSTGKVGGRTAVWCPRCQPG